MRSVGLPPFLAPCLRPAPFVDFIPCTLVVVIFCGGARSGGTRGQAARGGAFLILCEAVLSYSGFRSIGCFSASFLAGGCHKVNKLLEQLVGEQRFFELISGSVHIAVRLSKEHAFLCRGQVYIESST